MQIKLDENLGMDVYLILKEAGHNVSSVPEQGLTGAKDPVIISACKKEEKALVTLDLHFANPLNFPPREYAGIAVIRLPRNYGREHLRIAARTLLKGIEQDNIVGHLWIIDLHLIRKYNPLYLQEDTEEDG